MEKVFLVDYKGNVCLREKRKAPDGGLGDWSGKWNLLEINGTRVADKEKTPQVRLGAFSYECHLNCFFLIIVVFDFGKKPFFNESLNLFLCSAIRYIQFLSNILVCFAIE